MLKAYSPFLQQAPDSRSAAKTRSVELVNDPEDDPARQTLEFSVPSVGTASWRQVGERGPAAAQRTRADSSANELKRPSSDGKLVG